MLFPWANIPLLQISFQQRGNYSVLRLCQMCSGRTVDPSLPPTNFSIFLHSRDFDIKYPFSHYPQSNGKAVATVKAMKRIIRGTWNGRFLDEDKLCKALLQYRNTPSARDGLSPAQKLFGHPMQIHYQLIFP